ncbi:MAG: hypothetical protein ACI4EK_02560 [Wujia sp.]
MKKALSTVLILGCLVGSILLFVSGYSEMRDAVSTGLEYASQIVSVNGGMDTETYQILVTESIRSRQLTGFVFTVIGGLGALMSLSKGIFFMTQVVSRCSEDKE